MWILRKIGQLTTETRHQRRQLSRILIPIAGQGNASVGVTLAADKVDRQGTLSDRTCLTHGATIEAHEVRVFCIKRTGIEFLPLQEPGEVIGKTVEILLHTTLPRTLQHWQIHRA